MATDGPLDPWAIARTKLRRPAPSRRVVGRDRITEHLDGLVVDHAFTLISAPAGWGKTTAAAAWFADADATGASDGIGAWLTLDAGDDDVDAFWAAVAAALVEAGFSPSTLLTALRTVRSPTTEWRRFAAALVNDLAEVGGDVVLVLDDLQTVSDEVTLQSLAAFVDVLPARARIVATTRNDPDLPLALLRVRGRLGELRADILRFEPDEVDRLLNDVHHLGLDPESLRRLTERTEGWPAVLVLAGSSLEGLPPERDRDAAVRDAVATRDIHQFLSAELLDTCPEAERQFLLKTSILPLIDAGRARAITGVDNASTILEHFVDINLAGRLDAGSGPPVYRYNKLFAEFLRAELARTSSDDLVVDLHGRAAAAAGTDEEAIGYLLAARRWDEAADRIEAVGRAQQVLTLVRLPSPLLDALPAETQAARPWIRLLRSAIDVRHGDMVEAHRVLAGVVDELRDTGDDGLSRALSAFSEAAAAVGDWEGAGGAAAELLELPLQPSQRVPALATAVWLSYYDGDTEGVVAGIEEVIDLDPSDPQVCEGWLLALDFKLLGAPIDPAVVEAHCLRLQRRAPESAVLDATASGLRAGLAFLRGDVTAALALVDSGRLAGDRAGGLGWLAHEFDLVELMAALARSRHEEVERLAVPRLRDDDPIALLNRPQNAHALARSRWIRGDRPGLESVYADHLEHARPEDGYEMALAQASVAHMIERSAGNHQLAADRLAATLEAVPSAAAFAISQGHLALDLAAALLATGAEHEALNRARGPLGDLEARGLAGIVAQLGEPVVPLLHAARDRGVHAEFVGRALAMMTIAPATGFDVPTTGEHLSPRELEVLRLVAAGAGNRDIADQLFIAERTVKSHMTAILRKLGVTSRTQAAGEARRLGLV
ncbi:MAG: AAA family ATPase [Acidimicrobiales bacterium]|nr:AAA family ATPase [Acidimicrobiales bacterium]